MAQRPDTLDTALLMLELLRRIPRGRKITTSELHQQLKGAGFERDLRTIQRQLEILSEHFDIERDERSKPYGYRWLERAQGLALPQLTPQESLLLQLAEEHLKNLLPARLMRSMEGFFTQARRNLGDGPNTRLEREWPRKVRVVATSQPLLAPAIASGVLEAVSEALYANHWLDLDYRNAARQRRQARVMPLGLAQQGPRLYLVCRFEGFDNERSLALHRIGKAEVSTLAFERPRGFDLQKYDADGRFGFGEGQPHPVAVLHRTRCRLSPAGNAFVQRPAGPGPGRRLDGDHRDGGGQRNAGLVAARVWGRRAQRAQNTVQRRRMIGGQPFHSKRFQLSNQEFLCPCMSHVQTVRKASRPPAPRDFSPTAIPSECLHWPIGWTWPPESIPPSASICR
jgi:predicted DNA-binding transcriptional regulator YafY